MSSTKGKGKNKPSINNSKSKTLDLKDVWPVLEKIVKKTFDSEDSMSYEEYMQCFSLIYDYCLKGSKFDNVDITSPDLHDCPGSSNVSNSLASQGCSAASSQGQVRALNLGGRGAANTKLSNAILPGRKTPSLTEANNVRALYKKLDEFMKDYTKSILKKLQSNSDENTIVPLVSKRWLSFRNAGHTVSSMFQYMNRVITMQKNKGVFDEEIQFVYHLTLKYWWENVLLKLNDKIIGGLMKLIHNDRDGKFVHRGILKNVIGSYIEISFYDKFKNSSRVTYRGDSLHTVSQSSSYFTSIETNGSFSNNRIISDDWEQSVYRRYFETRFLNETQSYFKRESIAILQIHGFPNYAQYVRNRLKSENDRCLEDENGYKLKKIDEPNCPYIHDSTRSALKTICLSTLVEDHIQSIKEEVKNLLRAEKFNELKEVYEMLRFTPNCLEEIKDLLMKHVEKTGREAVQMACSQNKDLPNDEKPIGDDLSICGSSNSNVLYKNQSFEGTNEIFDEPSCSHKPPASSASASLSAPEQTFPKYNIDPTAFVHTIITIHEKFDQIVKTHFAGDAKFLNAVQLGCVNFIKSNVVSQSPQTYRPIKILANYYNSLLYKAYMYENDEEHEAKVKRAFIVFQLIEDKELFQKYYIEHLATRLLSRKNGSLELENVMVGKFKEQCGTEYTSQMQKMLRDKEKSSDLNNQFQEYNAERDQALRVPLHVDILSYGSWPLKPESECVLPTVFNDGIEQFERFYFNKHNGRKLTWLYLTSRVVLETQGFSETYTIKANVLQATVLYHFNKYRAITFQQLADITHIAENVLNEILLMLCRYKLILCCKNGETTNLPETIFEINDKFISKKLILNIYSKYIRLEEPKKDTTPRYVKDERRYLLEAAIVRIMKSRLRLSHSDLVDEILSQVSLRFVPQIKLIKTCIENLLDKEYLAREEGEGNIYIYLA